ncbi:MAG: TetR/AcrR family transcriptional regulator [Rhodospirillales bacterium]|nr:TetR/AcrR family transcriptional regulator [Rhodospirillales bacterium]
MARRSDHSREELYEMVLAEARKIVEAEGLSALTARRIGEAIGYSPGTLYNIFENLDDVIVHLNGRTLDDLYAHLAEVEFAGDPENDLDSLLARYLDFLDSNRNLWRVLFDFRMSAGRQLPDWFLHKVGAVLGLVEDALSPLFHGESRKAGDSARILWAGLHGICTLAETGKLQIVTSQTLRAMTGELVSNFVGGLRAGRSA